MTRFFAGGLDAEDIVTPGILVDILVMKGIPTMLQNLMKNGSSPNRPAHRMEFEDGDVVNLGIRYSHARLGLHS